MAPRPPAEPSRDGVHVDPFGDVTVPAKPRSWSQRRYCETYDDDVMTIWVLRADGVRVRYVVAGPLSARAVLGNAHPGDHLLVEWGRDDSGASVFPAALVQYATARTTEET